MLKLKSSGYLLITLSFLSFTFLSFTFLPVDGNSHKNAGPLSREKAILPGENNLIILKTNNKVPLNNHAKQFVQNYIRQNKKCLNRIRQRSQSPFATIDAVFSSYNLPVQLKYLAVIESELKTKALSQVGAKGPWQLMPETAHLLGLKITHAHDERTRYDKSTKAAAKYLKDLYAEFGDWLLVIAAYNGGEGPVYRAIHRSGSRNFWVLQSYLPAESRQHVKKFIATHYYFEGQGSVTTFTRAEWTSYNNHIRVEKNKVELSTKNKVELSTANAGIRHPTLAF